MNPSNLDLKKPTPKTEKHLAPWMTIQKLTGYHGQLTIEEITSLLNDQKIGTYIISNYDPDDPKDSHPYIDPMFTISFKWKLQDGSLKIVHAKGLCFKIPKMYNPFGYHSQEGDHPIECFYGKPPMKPLKNATPFSLKHWCRAVISTYSSYRTLENMILNKNLPKSIFDFITEKSSKFLITNDHTLTCVGSEREHALTNIKNQRHILFNEFTCLKWNFRTSQDRNSFKEIDDNTTLFTDCLTFHEL